MKRFAAFFRLASLLTLAVFIFGSPLAPARETRTAGKIGTIQLADLPPEAGDTLALIKQGGPFPFPRKDGSTFGNFEKRLPQRPRGYYREYTIPTPGRRDRGASRIVAGSGRSGNVAVSGEYYYTQDHYQTFYRIQEHP